MAGPTGRPARVLVVEDDFIVALELERNLADEGFQVVGVAGTAEEALEIATYERPDVAIMDVRLAGLRDGVDAATELYSTLGVRSIFATAHADDTTRQRASRASPLGWLEKPYSPEALISMVSKALVRGR
jgi:DNA-binding NarL/FixJ family response regulator